MSDTPGAPTPALELRGITKRFGEVLANDCVDLTLYPGEIHALVGENGAGKTTLMRILFGMYRADAGTVKLDGQAVEFHRPSDAIRAGIGMVHQHFMLVPSFTVAENVVLGAEPHRGGGYSAQAAAAAIAPVAERLGVTVDPDAIVGDLSVATQQKLEIMKVLYRGARVIVLDEPTAVLTPAETRELFVLLRRLAVEEQAAIVFISHKLREVFEIADRITVLRQGRTVESLRARDATTEGVVAAMTGRGDVNLGRVARDHRIAEAPMLRVSALATGAAAHDAALAGVSFTVRPGEIVGVAGVEGNGQSALVEALVGQADATAGDVALDGESIVGQSVSARRDRGLSFVPEDRQREGIPMNGSVLEGLAAGKIRRVTRWPWLSRALPRATREWASGLVDRHRIRTASIDTRCAYLSGGNQQKIVIARELEETPKLLVLSQPTRGVDLGAIDFIYERIIDAAAAGSAVLLISADLDELLRLSDRILVMYEGEIVAEEQAEATSRELLGVHMVGAGTTGEES
ncbi:ABC transporter ATP-binding protein [Leucobacter luti]|uniref:Nucleoside ABC transporter ATP-binding protein n=1 Tax=Leucobacter luti TaxID=340320 RepID=A0A4Q7U0E4_9MICO|nr:ABC transporter ATP-binding protein [Leucobacter luti]MBL3699361.1 ABC transporter ATP-binding protein [Leucobacter luti]RZT66871.1 nucleoside ABC transporter ATP-binding protein [Leucobacter luti]